MDFPGMIGLTANGFRALPDLLARPADSPLVLAGTLSVAFFLGAAHALTPGHGKALVAAYLTGSRGRLRDAFLLGGVVTLTHTASVFVLGLATLYAATLIPVERILPYVALLSGLLVTAVGLWLVWQRWRGHFHSHAHPHSHKHPHAHPHAHTHSHPHDPQGDHPASTGRWGLLSLGISGGLVPCPEALVLLLFSFSLGQAGYGLLLLLFFTLGLAAILIGIGSLFVMATPLIHRFSGDAPWLHWLPRVSALIVLALGILLITQAVSQIAGT